MKSSLLSEVLVSSLDMNLGWHIADVVSADLNCNGIEDIAVLAYGPSRVAVVVVWGPFEVATAPRSTTLQYRPEPNATGAYCSAPAELTVTPFRPAVKCDRLVLAGPACANFSLAWDREREELRLEVS